MKTLGKIKHKLRQVRHRLLQKAIRTGLSKKPCNCEHAGLVRGNSSEPLFYVCLLDSNKPREWEVRYAILLFLTPALFFKPFREKEQITQEFNRDFDALLSQKDIGSIASQYPDVAALLWVIAGEDDDRNIETEEK